MPTMKKQQRRYVKDQFQKLTGGGSMVGDQERNSMEGNLVQGAEQVQQAQQAQLGRAAQGQASGSPLTGQLRKSSQDVAKQGQDTAVMARAEANKLTAGLDEQRKAQAIGMMDREREIKRQNTELIAETGANIGSVLLGEGGL